MAWELQNIKAKHKCIIDLHLTGLTNVEIAEQMDCTEVSVGMILRSPIVQAEVSRRRSGLDRKVDQAYLDTVEEARSILRQSSLDASKKIVEQIQHEDPRVAQSACKTIFEECFGKTTKNAVAVTLNVEQLQLLQIALAEVGQEA